MQQDERRTGARPFVGDPHPVDVEVLHTSILLPATENRKEVAPAQGRREHVVAGQLLDPQATDGPGDDQLLDLLGAFEDVEGLFESGLYQSVPLTCGFSAGPCRSVQPEPPCSVQL